MFDIKNELEILEKTLFLLEKELNEPTFEKMQYQKAFWRAIRKKDFKQKCSMLFEIGLDKFGRIPLYSLDEFREDIKMRQNIQKMRNQLAALECSAMTELALAENSTSKSFLKETSKRNKKTDAFENGYIAFLVNSLDKGGLEQVVAFLARSLYANNVSIKVLCLDEGGLVANQLKEAGIEVLIFHGKGNQFRKYIRKNPPILVNSHYVKRHIRFLYKNKIPVVEVIHNMYVFYCEHVADIERNNEKYFSGLIAVSEIVKEIYCDRIKQTEKISVIGNAAKLREAPQKSKEEVRQLLGIPQDAYVILNVGSIDSRKNQVGMIAAFDIVSKIAKIPVYIVFAGNVQDEVYNAQVQESLSQCEYSSQVIILSYYERIRELYQIADVFLMDSYYEGWSIAATEALYDGVPLIHSLCGSAYELTDGGSYGIVVPNPAGNILELSNKKIEYAILRAEYKNTREVCAALLKMIDNREYWNKRRKSIAEESRKYFSEKIMIEKYMNEMEKVISGTRNG